MGIGVGAGIAVVWSEKSEINISGGLLFSGKRAYRTIILRLGVERTEQVEIRDGSPNANSRTVDKFAFHVNGL